MPEPKCKADNRNVHEKMVHFSFIASLIPNKKTSLILYETILVCHFLNNCSRGKRKAVLESAHSMITLSSFNSITFENLLKHVSQMVI